MNDGLEEGRSLESYGKYEICPYLVYVHIRAGNRPIASHPRTGTSPPRYFILATISRRAASSTYCSKSPTKGIKEGASFPTSVSQRGRHDQ